MTKRQMPEVRNPYNYDADKLSDQTGLLCEDESLTQQEHAEEADINYIAEKFMRTGQMPQVINMPTQGDFEGIFDFQSAMNIIADAKNEFMKLPAKIRSRFDNDPQKILEFLEDETNRPEAEALGLVTKKEPQNVTGSQSSTDTAPQAKTGDSGTAGPKSKAATTKAD